LLRIPHTYSRSRVSSRNKYGSHDILKVTEKNGDPNPKSNKQRYLRESN